MARSFQCTLVTPQSLLLDAQLTYASIPAADGQLGIMPGRAPLLMTLGDGPLRLDIVRSGSADSGTSLAEGTGQTRWFFVGGGFVQMKDDALSLVASEAVPLEQMTRDAAEAQLKEALGRMTPSDEQFVSNQRQQIRARTMLQLLQR